RRRHYTGFDPHPRAELDEEQDRQARPRDAPGRQGRAVVFRDEGAPRGGQQAQAHPHDPGLGGERGGLSGAAAPAAWERDAGVGRSGVSRPEGGDAQGGASSAGLHELGRPARRTSGRGHQGEEPHQVAGAREGRAHDWGDQADLRLPEGALPRTREEPAPARSQCRAGESVHDAATIAACVGAVSLKDEKCGDRKRKTPNRRAERIASLPVTRNRRRAAFSSQVLQRFPNALVAQRMEISPMTDTVVSSRTREVVLGLERPFVMIGERINPTGRKILAAEMAAGNFSRVEADALAQVAAGAHMLDVNAGIPLADEPAILARAVQLVQSITDLPLSIDSSIVKALEAGLAVYRGKPLVNSVTGEEERLEAVLPLVKKYGAAVVAISNDETGISEDPDVRFEVARKIVQRAADHGIPASDIVVDPLVMPIGAINQAGVQVMHLLRRLKNELR